VNNSTKIRLRNAVVDALSDGDDVAAHEMLGLLVCQPIGQDSIKQMPPLALPGAITIIDGPAKNYHYWMRFIRDNFLPFMHRNGRIQFTSYEVLSWLRNCGNIQLTAGDTHVLANGKEVWRNQVYSALANLKQMGVLDAERFAKSYTIKASKEVVNETSV
jgi:hypothetical protein